MEQRNLVQIKVEGTEYTHYQGTRQRVSDRFVQTHTHTTVYMFLVFVVLQGVRKRIQRSYALCQSAHYINTSNEQQ